MNLLKYNLGRSFCVGFLWIQTLLAIGVADEPKIVERFEGAEPSWTVRANPNALFIHKHLRSHREKRTGAQSEFIHFKTTASPEASLTHAIGPALVINDFCPFVWIKSNQDHIKLFARVILPKTRNPVGQGPLKVLVELDHSTAVGQWQKLGCQAGELVKSLDSRLFNIQFQFKELVIDRTDAYCDLVAIKGFSKPNTEYQVWLDDLSHQGFLPAKIRIQLQEEFSIQQSVQKVELNDGQFRVNGRPFFVRAIEHNGESFSFLKQLGFNSVVLDRLPTVDELEQAQQYQLWIICPPILSDNESSQDLLSNKNLEMVLAWHLGSNLTSSHLKLTRDKLEYLKRYDSIIKRPTICHAFFPVKSYAQFVDAQRIKHQTFGTSFPVSSLRESLAKRKKDLRAFLVDVQTRLPAKVLEQARHLPQSIGNGLLSSRQIQELTFEALLRGARGIVFESKTNLLDDQEGQRWLAPIFKSINRELIQIDPWIAGGLANSQIQKKQSSVTYELPRSQLTIVSKSVESSDPKIVLPSGASIQSPGSVRLGSARKRTQVLQVSTNQKSPRIYKITETGFVPVQHMTHVGNLKIELSRFQEIEKFVISEDSLSFEYIQKCTKSFAEDGGLLKNKYDVLSNSYERLLKIVDSVTRKRINSPRLFVSISEIKTSMEIVKTFLANRQLTSAQQMIKTVEAKLEHVCSSIQQELTASRTFVSSPFNSDFGQLANYVMLENAIQGRRWSTNLVPEGSFHKLSDLAQAGWSQHLNSSSVVQSSISLVNAQSKTEDDLRSSKAIQIQTWTEQPTEDWVDVTPVWISSPTLDLPANHLVRVEGYVRIEQFIKNSLDGFMVIDSIGGPSMGCRFRHTGDWEYFAIERVVFAPHQFGLVFAQTGLGQAQIANLQIRICDLASPKERTASQSPAKNNSAVPYR